MWDGNLIKKVSIRMGIFICISLIILFFIMEYFYLVYDAIFMFNYFLILFIWIFVAIRRYKKVKERIDFLSGIALGCLTTAIGIFPFILFFYIYCSFINPEFLFDLNLRISEPVTNLPTSIVPVIIMILGLFSGTIFSLILILFQKTKN